MPAGADTASQQEVIGFLSRPESYGAPGIVVERLETHCSIVFLAGDHALKLKRAITFASLDYSTVERRERACRAELVLNRRTAPDLYLAVRAIKRTSHGVLVFDGAGPPLDWVVMMRRFNERDLFDRMAGEGRLTPALMRALGQEIARFHQSAEVDHVHGGRNGVLEAIEHNHRELLRVDAKLDERAIHCLHAESLAAVERLAAVLDRRRDAGKVRRGHGDLRLANICLFHGRPTLFDCIEFSEEIGRIDVLYDLAFLLMDLRLRARHDLADTVLQAYLEPTGEAEGAPALPLFLSLRAATRSYSLAHAADRQSVAKRAAELTASARAHLAAALRFLHRPDRSLAAPNS
jgi:uncharacterized protein